MDPFEASAASPYDAKIRSSLATKPVLQKQTSAIFADALEHDILHEVQTF